MREVLASIRRPASGQSMRVEVGGRCNVSRVPLASAAVPWNEWRVAVRLIPDWWSATSEIWVDEAQKRLLGALEAPLLIVVGKVPTMLAMPGFGRARVLSLVGMVVAAARFFIVAV